MLIKSNLDIAQNYFATAQVLIVDELLRVVTFFVWVLFEELGKASECHVIPFKVAAQAKVNIGRWQFLETQNSKNAGLHFETVGKQRIMEKRTVENYYCLDNETFSHQIDLSIDRRFRLRVEILSNLTDLSHLSN